MAIYDDLRGKLSQTSHTAVNKVKDLSETVRLTGEISEIESQISELYKDIGYEIYLNYRENPIPEVKELLAQVDELHLKIEESKNQIQAIQALNTCPNCGSKIKPGMAFCSNCGSKLPEPTPEERGFCSKCGAPIVKGAQFCTSCGTPLK